MADPRDFKHSYPDRNSTIDKIISKVPPVPGFKFPTGDAELKMELVRQLVELYKNHTAPDTKRIKADLEMLYTFVTSKNNGTNA